MLFSLYLYQLGSSQENKQVFQRKGLFFFTEDQLHRWMEEWRNQIENGEAAQRFSKTGRLLPLLHEWYWEKMMLPESRSLGCQAEEARTMGGNCPRESWGQEGRGCPQGPCQILQEAGKERVRTTLTSPFLCFQSLTVLRIALTYQEPKNKRDCESRAGEAWEWVWNQGKHALSPPEMKRTMKWNSI